MLRPMGFHEGRNLHSAADRRSHHDEVTETPPGVAELERPGVLGNTLFILCAVGIVSGRRKSVGCALVITAAE